MGWRRGSLYILHYSHSFYQFMLSIASPPAQEPGNEAGQSIVYTLVSPSRPYSIEAARVSITCSIEQHTNFTSQVPLIWSALTDHICREATAVGIDELQHSKKDGWFDIRENDWCWSLLPLWYCEHGPEDLASGSQETLVGVDCLTLLTNHKPNITRRVHAMRVCCIRDNCQNTTVYRCLTRDFGSMATKIILHTNFSSRRLYM